MPLYKINDLLLTTGNQKKKKKRQIKLNQKTPHTELSKKYREIKRKSKN